MRATDFEFRYRFWFITLIFSLAFSCYTFDHVNAAVALVKLLAGRGFARDVAAILSRLNPPATVRVLELPDLPAGLDAGYWLSRFAGFNAAARADLHRLATAVPVVNVPSEGSTDAAAGAQLDDDSGRIGTGE